MPDIAIMTDSNCGILPEEGREMGITVVPMPIQIDGKTYLGGGGYYSGHILRSPGEGRVCDILPARARRSDGDVVPASERT